jgi:hypothetical protein
MSGTSRKKIEDYGHPGDDREKTIRALHNE